MINRSTSKQQQRDDNGHRAAGIFVELYYSQLSHFGYYVQNDVNVHISKMGQLGSTFDQVVRRSKEPPWSDPKQTSHNNDDNQTVIVLVFLRLYQKCDLIVEFNKSISNRL
jgi:hypothetical protein